MSTCMQGIDCNVCELMCIFLWCANGGFGESIDACLEASSPVQPWIHYPQLSLLMHCSHLLIMVKYLMVYRACFGQHRNRWIAIMINAAWWLVNLHAQRCSSLCLKVTNLWVMYFVLSQVFRLLSQQLRRFCWRLKLVQKSLIVIPACPATAPCFICLIHIWSRIVCSALGRSQSTSADEAGLGQYGLRLTKRRWQTRTCLYVWYLYVRKVSHCC